MKAVLLVKLEAVIKTGKEMEIMAGLPGAQVAHQEMIRVTGTLGKMAQQGVLGAVLMKQELATRTKWEMREAPEIP